jgi:nitrogen fixation protein FixH
MRAILLGLALGLSAVLAQQPAKWKITYELPAKVQANYDTPLTVKIVDAKGKPVDGAEVETILTMTEMDHGEFKEAAKREKPGVYKANQKFIMVGSWNIEVKAKKGNQSASQKFRYEVKE